MKKDICKTLIITLIYSCEGYINGNKSILGFILTFICILSRSIFFGEDNNKKININFGAKDSVIKK
jgi:hypothetical protein